MPIRRTLCLLAAMLGAGCSDSTSPRAALDGSWSHFDPAFRYGMTLTTNESTLTGAGQWSGEACCVGTVVAHGTVDDEFVDFELDFVATQGGLQLPAPFSQHFTGRRIGSDSLDGVLTATGQPIPFGYHRTRSPAID